MLNQLTDSEWDDEEENTKEMKKNTKQKQTNKKGKKSVIWTEQRKQHKIF